MSAVGTSGTRVSPGGASADGVGAVGIGPTPARPAAPVGRVVLGADAWALLLADAAALDLPAPFAAGGALTPPQAAAAEAALRLSDAVTGTGGGLVADLHPSLRASLLLQLTAGVVLEVAVAGRAARFAVGPVLASGLVRSGLGPVTLLTLLPDAVASQATGLLPGLAPAARGPGREPVRLDAATSVAASLLLAEGRADLSVALLGHAVPAALGIVTAAARLEVAGPRGRRAPAEPGEPAGPASRAGPACWARAS